jgi:hypothetical protein
VPQGELAEKKKKLIITLPSSSREDVIKKLSQFFDRCELGAMKIYLNINGKKLETPYCVKDQNELSQKIKEIIPEAIISFF